MKKSEKVLSVGFLYDDSLDRPDGVSQYVKTVGAWLNSQGHKVIYLVGETTMTQWAGSPVYSLSKNLTVKFNGNLVNTPLPASKKLISSVLDRHDFDVIHVQMPYSPFMAQKVINLVNPHTAVIGTFHIYPAGALARVGSRLLRLVYRGSLKKFRGVLSVSPPAAKFAKQFFAADSELSSNVVELKKYQKAKKSGQKNHVVFLGRLVQRKGCGELLRAFKLLIKTVPEAKLTIAGDGPQRNKLESFVKNNHLESSVTFQGFINEHNKPKLLGSAAIACFPSLGGESFGIVLIEAMAAGAGVVIGGNNPGYTSVLGERPKTLFDPKKTAQFAKTLEKFLTDGQLADGIHTWQNELVRKYDIETVGPSLVEVYKRAIAKQNRSRHN